MTINSEDGTNIQLELRDLVKNNKFTVNIKMWEEFKNDLTKNSAPFVQEMTRLDFELFLDGLFSKFERGVITQSDENEKVRDSRNLKK